MGKRARAGMEGGGRTQPAGAHLPLPRLVDTFCHAPAALAVHLFALLTTVMSHARLVAEASQARKPGAVRDIPLLRGAGHGVEILALLSNHGPNHAGIRSQTLLSIRAGGEAGRLECGQEEQVNWAHGCLLMDV